MVTQNAQMTHKIAVVDEVRTRIGEASASIVSEYRGLSVAELAELRIALAAVGGDYRIFKNTLVRRAIDGGEYQPLSEYLSGPSALTFVQGDVSAVAKALKDFARANPLLVIKGGLADGSLLSSSDLSALADLPPRDVLLARLAGALAAPMQQMAGLLQALPRNLAYGLSALIEQREAGGETAARAAEARAAEAPAEAEAPQPRPRQPRQRPGSGRGRRAEAPAEAEAPEAEAPAEPRRRPKPRPRQSCIGGGRGGARGGCRRSRSGGRRSRLDAPPDRTDQDTRTRPKERKEGHSDGRDPDEGPDPRWNCRVVGDPVERAVEGVRGALRRDGGRPGRRGGRRPGRRWRRRWGRRGEGRVRRHPHRRPATRRSR